MDVTAAAIVIAILGLILIMLLATLQWAAVVKPRSDWVIANVYGGDPALTDTKAYFAFNQGMAWADVVLWAPMQIAGSVGMLLGQRWGFLLALAASVTYVYTAITIYRWDRDLGFRENTIMYWVVIWGMWPVFGAVQGVYTFVRLVG